MSSACITLLLSLKTSHCVYLEIILQDYDMESTAAGGAAMDMEISVTGCVHTWQCFLRCDASRIQWGMEFPGDSPFVFQETADKFGLAMLSQERHAPDSSSYILFTG